MLLASLLGPPRWGWQGQGGFSGLRTARCTADSALGWLGDVASGRAAKTATEVLIPRASRRAETATVDSSSIRRLGTRNRNQRGLVVAKVFTSLATLFRPARRDTPKPAQGGVRRVKRANARPGRNSFAQPVPKDLLSQPRVERGSERAKRPGLGAALNAASPNGAVLKKWMTAARSIPGVTFVKCDPIL